MTAAPQHIAPVVLVVDDEPVNRELLEAVLEPEGYTVLQAADAAESFAAVAAHEVDLILMDISMPGMNGIEACLRLRTDPRARHVPLVFVTALTDRQSRIQGKAAGADEFLTKPIDEVELKVRVTNLLSLKAARDQETRHRLALELELDRARGQLLKLERLATLGTLAAGVGHEINNVAAVLSSLAGALEEQAKEGAPPLAEDIADLRTVTQHVTTHGRQLMRLGRPGGDATERLDLGEVVRDTLALLQTAGRTKLFDVAAELAAEPVMVEVNRTRLEQVLVNLVGNAVDALDGVAGRARSVRVSVGRDEQGRPRCAVTDSGSGIAADKLEAIFEPYFTTKPPGKGTGLGLPVVRQIVRDSGGELEVKSVLGEGSCFSFVLPAATMA